MSLGQPCSPAEPCQELPTSPQRQEPFPLMEQPLPLPRPLTWSWGQSLFTA